MIDLPRALPLSVLVAAAACYGRGILVLWNRGGLGAGVARWRVASFFAGLAVVAFAVLSPLDDLAHAAFSMHMVQHVLLLLVAPPLLMAGSPLLPLLWCLPGKGRRRLGRAWRRARPLRQVWHVASGPLVVGCIAAVVLWAWHLPSLYQAALVDPWIHGVEHGSLLASSCLLWWLVLQPLGRPRLHGGSALLLVFATKVHSTVLAALITFAGEPLYPVYEAGSVAARGSLLEDQRLAGVIMGWPMALVYVAAAAALFLGWLRTIHRRVEGSAPARSAPG